MNASQTIYLCDDEDGVRDALAFLLKQHNLRVSAYASGPELLAAIDAAPQPVRGVFLIDGRMEPMSGAIVHEQLLARGLLKRNPVIFLSRHGSIRIAVDAIAKGALSFVEKTDIDEHLVPVLEQALALEEQWHKQALRSDFLRALWQDIQKAPQQRRVALYVADGFPNKVTAGRMNISERMVEVHRAKVYEKLGIDSAQELSTTLAEMRAELARPSQT
jgi:two-component system response regulator DctR